MDLKIYEPKMEDAIKKLNDLIATGKIIPNDYYSISVTRHAHITMQGHLSQEKISNIKKHYEIKDKIKILSTVSGEFIYINCEDEGVKIEITFTIN